MGDLREQLAKELDLSADEFEAKAAEAKQRQGTLGRDYDASTMAKVLLPEVGDGYDEDLVYKVLQEHRTLLKQDE